MKTNFVFVNTHRLALPLMGLREEDFDKMDYVHPRGYDQLESTRPVSLIFVNFKINMTYLLSNFKQSQIFHCLN